MEIQIAIWTPDETHSSVRSWQPIFLMIITLLLHLRASSMRGREPRNAVEDLALRGRNPERFISARLRLPGVKRNGRGHRRAKRRPPPRITFPYVCLDTLRRRRRSYLITSPTRRPSLATVASQSSSIASRSLSFSTPWPYAPDLRIRTPSFAEGQPAARFIVQPLPAPLPTQRVPMGLGTSH